MACPFLASMEHSPGSTKSSVCPLSGNHSLPDQQGCPMSGPSTSGLTHLEHLEASLPWQNRGFLSLNSSSDSLTEHQDLDSLGIDEPAGAFCTPDATGVLAVPLPGTATARNGTGSSSSSRSRSVHQSWQLKRPLLHHDPKFTRRQLRRLARTWTLADVAEHCYCDDGWIAVDGKVYDITEHLVNHPGWDSGCQVTTVLSIIAHLGTDCSEEFRDIHRPYPVAWKQLQAYYIGDLARG